jgi:outer membrane protein assembly factor BamE (lipoprotein component of BamABCDE complex)
MIKNAVFVTFLAIFSVGCSNMQKKVTLLNHGDTKQRVLDVMGQPDDTQMSGDRDAWQYCGVDSFATFDNRVIWFKAGKLVGTSSYKANGAGSCTGYIKMVDWNNSPDLVLEIRNK